jgi:hypothetical protein
MGRRGPQPSSDAYGVGSVERQRERYKKAGLVQVNAWVPADKAQEIREDCARLRHEYLRQMGYFDQEEDRGD